jgi:hypothetical protein
MRAHFCHLIYQLYIVCSVSRLVFLVFYQKNSNRKFTWRHCCVKISVKLFDKGPFKYYVIMFLTFLGPPFDDLLYCKSSKNAIFWPHPPTYLFDDVILEWTLWWDLLIIINLYLLFSSSRLSSSNCKDMIYKSVGGAKNVNQIMQITYVCSTHSEVPNNRNYLNKYPNLPTLL